MFGEPCRSLGGQAPIGISRGQIRGALDTSEKSLDFTEEDSAYRTISKNVPLALRVAAAWSRHWGGFQGGGGCNVSH